jgi:hypothetical protein
VVTPDNYPRDLGSMIKYNTEFKKKISSRYYIHISLTMDQLDQFRDQYNQEKFSGLVRIDEGAAREAEEKENKEPKERKILKEMQGVSK